MASSTDLVSGRLGITTTFSGTESRTCFLDERKSYGVSRLGLDAGARRQRLERGPAEEQPLFKKCTFKLSRKLAEKLRDRAALIDRYQYSLVEEAIRGYLVKPTEPPRPGFRRCRAARPNMPASLPNPVVGEAKSTSRTPKGPLLNVVLAPLKLLRLMWAWPRRRDSAARVHT
ncbi:MAG: hypothetical protein ACYTF6_07895 [Planctomycetota bacterium]|jgi:hypothetical protein